jgi:hypothetical protein
MVRGKQRDVKGLAKCDTYRAGRQAADGTLMHGYHDRHISHHAHVRNDLFLATQRPRKPPGPPRALVVVLRQAYFWIMAPRFGSAAWMCLPAPPRTALYALTTVARPEPCAMSSVTASSATDTSSPRLAR